MFFYSTSLWGITSIWNETCIWSIRIVSVIFIYFSRPDFFRRIYIYDLRTYVRNKSGYLLPVQAEGVSKVRDN